MKSIWLNNRVAVFALFAFPNHKTKSQYHFKVLVFQEKVEKRLLQYTDFSLSSNFSNKQGCYKRLFLIVD